MNDEHPRESTDIEPATSQFSMDEEVAFGSRIARIGLWLVCSLGFIAFIVLGKVRTHLGVEAVPWDKHGREYVWRVWWRSRHRIVDLGPAWGSALVLGCLAVGFVALSMVAVWIALVAERPEMSAGARPDSQHPPKS